MTNNINETLAEGMIIKNYKEMCKMLNEEEKGGKSKQLQLEDWRRFFEYEKDGQKFNITDIFLTPLEKSDNRGKSEGSRCNNSVYIKFIEILLLYMLYKKNNNPLVCTKNYLLLSLGMVDDNYISNDYRKYLIKNNKFNRREIHEFDLRSYTILDRILFSALNSLKNRFLITWNQELHYVIENIYGDDVDVVASNIDEEIYLTAKYDIAREIGIEEGDRDKYDKLRDIFFHNKSELFYAKLKEKLFQEHGWKYTCIQYRIIFNKDNVEDAIPRTEKQLKKLMQKNKNELNEKIIEALNNNAKSKYLSNQEKINNEIEELKIINNTDYIPDEVLTTFILPNNYIIRQSELANELIKINKGKKYIGNQEMSRQKFVTS